MAESAFAAGLGAGASARMTALDPLQRSALVKDLASPEFKGTKPSTQKIYPLIPLCG